MPAHRSAPLHPQLPNLSGERCWCAPNEISPSSQGAPAVLRYRLYAGEQPAPSPASPPALPVGAIARPRALRHARHRPSTHRPGFRSALAPRPDARRVRPGPPDVIGLAPRHRRLRSSLRGWHHDGSTHSRCCGGRIPGIPPTAARCGRASKCRGICRRPCPCSGGRLRRGRATAKPLDVGGVLHNARHRVVHP